jgi:hypothetical protein
MRGRHHPQDIFAGVKPNPGNPTEVSITERQRFKPSRGKIVDVLHLTAYKGQQGRGFVLIGIFTK